MIESRNIIVNDEFMDMFDNDRSMVMCELNIISNMICQQAHSGVVFESELYDLLGMKYYGEDKRGIVLPDISIETHVDVKNDMPIIAFSINYDVDVE